VTGAQDDALRVIVDVLTTSGLEWEMTPPATVVATLPGERKLRTTVALVVGTQSVAVDAFVARHPDENDAGVHRWLLERNRRLYGVSFAIDHLGDIYLTGHIPLHAVTPEEVDRVLGCVLEYADSSFNTILELGFAGAIRREWEWRTSRGESTANLAPFAHLASRPSAAPDQSAEAGPTGE
jgi:hypothetical protein